MKDAYISIDVPVFTSEGWTTQGNLRKGDFVYAPDGTATIVLATSKPKTYHGLSFFELEFDCGEKIITSERQPWITQIEHLNDNTQAIADRKIIQPDETGMRVTSQIFHHLYRSRNVDHVRYRHFIPLANPLIDMGEFGLPYQTEEYFGMYHEIVKGRVCLSPPISRCIAISHESNQYLVGRNLIATCASKIKRKE